MNRFEPHCHFRWSNTRLLDAINDIKPTVEYAIEIGLKGLSVTDHGCVSGWVKANQLQQELDKQGIDFKIALGEEGYLVDKRENGIKYFHIIWIAKDKVGARQIRRLSSLGNLNSYYDRGMERVPVTKEEVEMVIGKDKGHIIVTSACLGGEISTNILAMESARKIGDIETANCHKQNIVDFILWAKELFGDDFYLEVAPAASREQIIANKKMVELAQCFNLKIVLGCDAHYLKNSDRHTHEAFLNSRGDERETDLFYKYAYLQTEEEIKENLSCSIVDLYDTLCENSMEIYNKIEKFNLDHPQKVPTVEVEDYPKKISLLSPKYKTLHEMFNSEDKMERYWVNKCVDKLEELNKNTSEYFDELEEEAEIKRIVGKRLGTNMFSYPVALSKYIDLFWECGSSVGAGRGSACSALNHYLLGVTQLDPLEWDFPFFRYMNRDTDGLGDIDLDLCPSRLPYILRKIKEERAKKFSIELTDIEKKELGCVYVCTFGTETSKSAVQTACRGYRGPGSGYTKTIQGGQLFDPETEGTTVQLDGIDNDVAQYLSSLVPVERGFVWSISDVYYGNQDKERKPIVKFKEEVDKYPGLLNIMLGIEGAISRKGRHASGVLFNDEDPYEFNAYMKTPSGEVVTQWDLHDAEWAGSTKMDLLVTEIQDKIVQTIKFLQEDGLIEKELNLREAYDKYLHPDVLPIEDDNKTWEAIQNASTLDLFQLDSPIGRQGAKKIKPDNMIELSSTNGLIRLMTAEKGSETWLDKYVRFKNNRNDLIKEFEKYGLTKYEINAFKRYVGTTNGIGISQEQIMKSLMDKDLCDFSLKDANKARKTISKKKMNEIPALKEKIFAAAKSESIANYLWDYIVSPSLGYGFSDIHSVSYSFIGFQSAYIATHWNPIYWNCSCLVVNSGALEEQEEELVSIYEKEDENCEYEDLPDRSAKKKKDKNSDYAKIAKAIGKIKEEGIEVSLININTSDYGFKPDIENNRILYGLKALSNINSEVIEKIKAGRPYCGIKDFMSRCPLTKTATINLIKAGAFDEIEKDLSNRKEIMAYYLYNVSDLKKKLTLQNFNGLITHNIIPLSLEHEIKVFNFNKYLKAARKKGLYYVFDEHCLRFYNDNYNVNDLEVIQGIPCIKQTDWDKMYKKEMDKARDWLKENQESVLNEYNNILFKETWDNYAQGTISTWEMDSLCMYHNEHELIDVNKNKYGISKINDLISEDIDYYFKRNGREIPIYKISRIIGTVISKDDNRSSFTLLTPEGVITVKATREYYSMFKKQISQIQPDGTKKVIDKSWLKRGTKLLLQGFLRDDTFVMKTYKNTEGHQLYKITEIAGDEIKIQHERLSGDGASVEDEYEN